MRSVEFEGKEYEYDETALKRYRVIKLITRGESEPAGFFDALEILFAGRDVEYAEALGGDEQKKMGELVAAVFQQEAAQDRAVKN